MYTKGGDTTCTCNSSSVYRGWYLYITVYKEGSYTSQCTKMVPLSHSVQRKDTHLSQGIKEILSLSNTVHRRVSYISHCTQKGSPISHTT